MEIYKPTSEVEADKQGQISYDGGLLQQIDFHGDVVGFAKNPVEKREILDFGKEGYLLKNLLTVKECEDIVQKGEEIGFESIHGASDTYRSCKRIAVENKQLSDYLWERIQPFLSDIKIDGDPALQHIHGITSVLQGLWKPVGLNNVFRLCRYLPGGHFAPHYDGFFN